MFKTILEKLNEFKNRNNLTEAQEMCETIRKARTDVERAENLFNEVTDQAICDYAAYNILAAKARYHYLLKLAKEKNIHFS